MTLYVDSVTLVSIAHKTLWLRPMLWAQDVSTPRLIYHDYICYDSDNVADSLPQQRLITLHSQSYEETDNG